MRPLLLEIASFGPYADTQIIDFENNCMRGIFLITGPTGAGKTTVFDAIAFALFGKASGESRKDAEMFKSDHATPDDICYVSLTFLIGSKRYTVKRQPKQTRRIRGGGVSAANGNAWLTMPDGTIFSGISEVNARIETVLGLTYNQFRQIVMLPQGEFKRLLESPSDEKQAIFRRIFGTEMLERSQKILDAEYHELDERLKATSARAEEGVAMLACDEASELKALIDSPHTLADICDVGERLCKSDKTAVKNTVKKIEALNKKRDEINLAAAETTNKKLDRIAEVEKLIAAEQAKSEDVSSSEAALERARCAAEIKPIIIRAEEYRKISEDNKAAASTLKAELDGLNSALDKAKLMRDKSSEKTNEKNKLLNKLVELKGFEDIFSSIEACEKKETELKALIEKSKSRAEVLLSLKQRSELFEQTAETKRLADFAGGFVALIDKFTSSARASLEASLRYTDCYNRYLMGQAGIMAKKLEDGKPCPVCGAADHPCPAVCSESIPDENEVRALKETADRLFAEESRLQGMLNADFRLGAERGIFKDVSQDKIPAQQEKFADIFDKLSRKSAELSSRYRAESEKIKVLMNNPDAIDDDKYLDSNFIESRLAECEKAVSASEINLAACGEEILRLKARLPSGITSDEILTNELARIEDNIKQLESEIAEAEARFAEISKNINDVGARLNSAAENAESFGKKAQTALNEFALLLAEKGFASREEFDGCILSGDDIAKAEAEIAAYRAQLADLNTELKILTADCAGLKYADIPALEKAFDEIVLEIKRLDEVKTRLTVRCENNKKQLDRIKAAALAIADDEKLFKDIGLLCKLSRGDNNAKISFERYVLGSYFADIIAKSNLWLSELTGGKYRLLHKQDKGKGRGAAGLDLEVFDIHTGKSRHVSTLSGGESFKASLSLALGLADVIQEYSGGVSIDTMFIDEGFGSLDDLSREKAIDSLFELEKTGRLIGVISHVAELRERIAVRLEVTPTPKGSRIAFA